MVHRWEEADVPVLQREGGSEEDVQQPVSFLFCNSHAFILRSICHSYVFPQSIW